MRRVVLRAASLLLALLLALSAAGCKPRPEPTDSRHRDEGSEVSEVPDEDVESEVPDDEPESGVDAEEVARGLLDDGLVTVAANYNNEVFDSAGDINTSQMLWSVFKLYESQGGEPDGQDYEGYSQLSKKKVDKLVRRWYGEDAPAFEGKPQVLGDAASNELVNLDEEKGAYYFLEIDQLADEVLTELVDAKANTDGSVTIKYDTENAAGEHAYRYVIKVRPGDGDGYYIASLNRGQARKADKEAE